LFEQNEDPTAPFPDLHSIFAAKDAIESSGIDASRLERLGDGRLIADLKDIDIIALRSRPKGLRPSTAPIRRSPPESGIPTPWQSLRLCAK
jgi:hypothetical protein